MKKILPPTIIKIVAVLMLLWALTDNPYGYYQMLRWIICGVTGYSVYLAYKNKENIWICILGVIAILFNPILPIYLNREVWAVIDVIAAIIIFISIFAQKNIVKKTE